MDQIRSVLLFKFGPVLKKDFPFFSSLSMFGIKEKVGEKSKLVTITSIILILFHLVTSTIMKDKEKKERAYSQLIK